MDSSQIPKEKMNTPGITVLYSVYYLMLLAMLVASFYPAYRVWGFNHWAYYPSYVAIVLFCVGAMLPFVIGKFPLVIGAGNSEEAKRQNKFLVVAAILILVYLAMFYLLRAKTHFLGDGYTLLASFSPDKPIIKSSDYGTSLIHLLAYSLVMGERYGDALLAYQIVSWLGGLVFVVITLLFTRRLFRATADRVLFALGVLSGGYMLMFFGYAEHYSLFVPSVAWFTLTGLLIAKGEMNRWSILPPLVIAIFLHIFGLFLIPVAIYLLILDTKVNELWIRLSFGRRLAVVMVVAILSLSVFYRLYTTDLYFRFAFVPIVEDKFTVEGYTMFSSAHLADIGNLVVLLFPGIGLITATLFFLPVRKIFRARDHLFLLILLLFSLSAVLIFDPKLGMPRDWDLFSFCGVPLAVWGYYIVVQNLSMHGLFRKVATMAIFLGLVVLIPRAVGRADGEIELSHLNDYIRLDVKKSHRISWLIREYYAQRGDTANAQLMYQQRQKYYPELELIQRGLRAKDEGRLREAIGYFRSAVDANPMYAQSYVALGTCYAQVGHYDSATVAFRTAEGMNPYLTPALIELARLYRVRNQMEESEEYFRRALEVVPGDLDAGLGLLELYWTSDQVDKHNELLVEVAKNADAPPVIHKRLGDHYFSQGAYNLAEKQYLMAIDKGMDPSQLEGMLEKVRGMKK